MSVNLTDAEIRQFELAGITKEMIGKTIERDRAAGLSDQDIELKAASRAEILEKQNPSFTQGRGISRAISNLPFGDTINRGIQGAKALYDATLDYATGNNKPTLRQYLEAPEGVEPKDRSWGELFHENYNENMNKLKRTFQEQNYDVPKLYRYTMDAAGTIGSYGLLPEGIYSSVPSAAAFAAADSYQSGIDKSVKDRSINAAVGGITAGVLTGLVNKISGASTMKKVEKEYPLLADGFRKNPPKTAEEALDRATKNFVQKSQNPQLQARVNEEAKRLFGNIDDKTFKTIAESSTKNFDKSPLGKALTKRANEAIKLNETAGKLSKEAESLGKNSKGYIKAFEKSLDAAEKYSAADKASKTLSAFREIASSPTPINTEGLGGGLIGALGGGLLGGPWGAIAGGLLGSKGRVIPIIGDVIANSGKRSATKIANALVNPKNMSKTASAALKLIPKTQSNPKNLKTESGLIKSIYGTIAGESKKDNKNKSSLVYPTSNNIIILPESSDSGESITQKHLQLLAALDPNFFSGTKVA